MCKSSTCVCFTDSLLPTKSTLSSSVTEFPNSLKRLNAEKEIKIEEKIPQKSSDLKLTSETIAKKHSFDSKINKQFDPHHQKFFRKNETSFLHSSTSFPSKPFKLESKPFLPYQEYISAARDQLSDCLTCTRVLHTQRPPSEPSDQQVSRIKHL